MSSNAHREERLNQAIAEFLRAAEAGQAPEPEHWLEQHADLAEELRSFLADRAGFRRFAADVPTGPGVLRSFGDYELLEEIARGGMGVVYKAHQLSLPRTVALKMILAGQLATPAEVQRFHNEAEAAAQLDHEHIVPVYEVGEHEGQHYFSMAFLEGGTLADRLRSGPLPPRDAAELVRRLALAVQYAHDRGIVHRDLKPANVLFTGPLAAPKIADFGLAKRVEKADGPTLSGEVIGTPSFMPPEQASGHVNLVGPLADVYGLGGILYACLCGRAPFQAGSTLDTLLQVIGDEPTRPTALNPAVPRDLETICLKCLEKRLERRYASAQELADDLGRFLNTEPIHARPTGPFRRAWAWTQQRPWVISAVVGLLLLLTTCTAYALWANARQQRSEASLQQVRATLLLLQSETAPGEDRSQLLQESRGKLSAAARTAGAFPTAALHDATTALLLFESQGGRRLPLSAATAGEIERLVTRRESSPQSLSAQVSADGKLVLVSGPAHALLLETDTGKVIHTAKASRAALDPGGRWLALADDKVRLLRLPDGRAAEPLPRQGGVHGLGFSPDGQQLAVVGGNVEVWHLEQRKRTLALPVAGKLWYGAAFSGDGRRLLIATLSGEVEIWELAGERRIAAIPADTASHPLDAAFSPDGRRLARITTPETVEVVDLDTNARQSYRWAEPARPWYAWQPARNDSHLPRSKVTFSPDGRFLAALGEEETLGVPRQRRRCSVLLWEVDSGREYLRLPCAAFAGFTRAGDVVLVRHPAVGDAWPTGLELWQPESVRTALPAELLPAMRAPYSYWENWGLLPSGFPYPILVFNAVLFFPSLARRLLGGYDVEGGWRGAASLLCMTVPALLIMVIGFYCLFTMFDRPNWRWLDLLLTWTFGAFGISAGVNLLRAELSSYHRVLTQGRAGESQPAPAARIGFPLLAFLLLAIASVFLLGDFVWKLCQGRLEANDVWLLVLPALLLVGVILRWRHQPVAERLRKWRGAGAFVRRHRVLLLVVLTVMALQALALWWLLERR